MLRMSVTKNTKETMIKACRHFYRNNHEEEKNIFEFNSRYSSDKAIWWYTRPCFCYRLTNKVLNTQDPDWLYTFRLIITDIHNQLLELYEKFIDTPPQIILRGKVVPSSLVYNLQENVGGLISINGFLSATTSEQIRDIYGSRDNPVREGYERVLFRLIVDNHIKTKPFAFIKDYSAIPEENEVLFSIGTVWCIESVEQDDEALWHIVLRSSDWPTLLTLGNFLSEIKDYNKADKYYEILLKELPKNHKDIGAIYSNRGCLQCEKGAYDLAEHYFNCAIESISAECPSSILIAQCNIEVNTVDLITKSLSSNDRSLGKLYNNIGYIHYKRGQNEVAMKNYQQAINILLQPTNRNPADLSAVYNNIGVIYFKAKRYDDALKSFQSAIEYGLLLLSPTHQWIIDYAKNKKIVLKYIEANCEQR
ncbi:unnamed protein product [Didymodactylos carnosus]|uniref:Tetratricopeptide repeat protein n=1 Tax=Didymodactylos carnosus TaxID=1234261 RepID=A0A814TY39_9BILA|nr:unnamed protein product [Didymodactylos carnosus]CAF1167372.1 unnamed protein product [Didymodactylos carnosus]CAF3736313.1 unnamed protein product [Didymodactylos carnosus]CAF3930928.1 unnamed protein product [Didymodactylos carnosus]